MKRQLPLLLILVSMASYWSLAQTFDQKRDWLFSQPVPTSSISGSGKYGMPYGVAKLWQTNGSDFATRQFCVWVAQQKYYLDQAQTQRDYGSEIIFETQGVVRSIYQWSGSFNSSQHNAIAAAYREKRDWAGGGTENHEFMRWCSGYLLAQKYGGQWYATTSSSSLQSDTSFMSLLKSKILIRAEQVYRQDISEYNSPNYLIHHFIPLLNLYDFCQDSELAMVAEAIIARHLSSLSLCTHDGGIVEPFARWMGPEDLGSNSLSAKNESLLMAWIYWGQINPSLQRIQDRYSGGPLLYYLAASNYRPPQRLVEIANGDIGVPGEIKMHSAQWHDSYYRATNRRYIWRQTNYAIGSGMRYFDPDEFYMQHSKFGVHWTSSDARRSLLVGHPYWHADDNDWQDWLQSTDSPFMQSVHYKDVAIILFNHPAADPWPNRGRPEWYAQRANHVNGLRTEVYTVFPDSVDQYLAFTYGDGTRWYFMREGDVYIGVRVLTTTWTGHDASLGLRIAYGRTQLNGQRYQSAFVVEVSNSDQDISFSAFQDRLKSNTLTVNWGTGSIPAQTVTYNNGLGINLSATYDTDYNENSNGLIWMHPSATLNGSSYNWFGWPYFSSEYISMSGKRLTIEEQNFDLIYDLNYLPTP